MTARVFCMASAKGGSGKTMLAATFGVFLASIGKRVLLVDTDAATNGLSLFYLQDILDKMETGPHTPLGLFEWGDVATDSSHEADVITVETGLDLLPTTYRFQNTESVELGRYRMSLARCVDLHRQDYDYKTSSRRTAGPSPNWRAGEHACPYSGKWTWRRCSARRADVHSGRRTMRSPRFRSTASRL
jgi:hypothetical protein